MYKAFLTVSSWLVQAAEFIFAAASQPPDVLQEPLHRINGIGHLAAATSMWALKVGLGFGGI
jgi:hypothetical protein